MYKKGTALELQFSPARLNSNAGDPYWIDLSRDEARHLKHALDTYFDRAADIIAPPLVVALDGTSEPERVTRAESVKPDSEFAQYVCVICGWIYDEASGDPESGIAPGTRWRDIPDDWRCPLCDVGKEDFALVEF